MAGSPLSVIIDDSRTDAFVFGPLEWTRTDLPEWFNSTSQSPTFALNPGGPLGTVQMRFEGTSVAFFGNTPPGNASQTFSVSIDGSVPSNSTYGDPNPPTYRQWYQSPILEEGTHNIAISNIAGASVDYAVITVGEDTPLAGTLVIADNDDPGFNFTGKWRRSQEPFNSGPQPDGNPYHNTTHQTHYVGDFFTYHFSGSSAAIYGIFTWSNVGVIELTFTLDGQSLSQTYRVSPNTPQFISELGQQQNFLFYSYDVLPAGEHELTVNLTACENQTLEFDYVTYSPSFATLGTMPDLTSGNDAEAMQQAMSKNSHIGIIAAAVGGVVILLLLGVIIFIFRRRRKNKRGLGLELPFHNDRPSIRHIPIMSPPSTGSSYNDSGTMSLMQNTSSAEYSSLLPRQTNDTALTPLRPVRRLPLPVDSVTSFSTNTLPVNRDRDSANAPLLSRAAPFGVSQGSPPSNILRPISQAAETSPNMSSGRQDRFSEWGGSVFSETPPPYDARTRERPRPALTYF